MYHMTNNTKFAPTLYWIIIYVTHLNKILFGVNICFIPKTSYLPSDSNWSSAECYDGASAIHDNHIPFYNTYSINIVDVRILCGFHKHK